MSDDLDPVSQILNAGLELAQMEITGDLLDPEARRLLDACDEIGAVRAIAAHDAGRPEPRP